MGVPRGIPETGQKNFRLIYEVTSLSVVPSSIYKALLHRFVGLSSTYATLDEVLRLLNAEQIYWILEQCEIICKVFFAEFDTQKNCHIIKYRQLNTKDGSVALN